MEDNNLRQVDYSKSAEAYVFLCKIEIGIREFLISLIRTFGVNAWTSKFLGESNIEAIKEVGKRIHDAEEKNLEPKVEDVYLKKIYNNLKEKNSNIESLFHPFYYFTFSELIKVLKRNPTKDLILETINEKSLEILLSIFDYLNVIRNDVAHARLINDSSLQVVSTSFTQILALIPNFDEYYNKISIEENPKKIFEDLQILTDNLKGPMLDNVELENTIQTVKTGLSSFWLNAFAINLIPQLHKLLSLLITYKEFRSKPGGLLDIHNLRPDINNMCSTIKNLINGRKI